MKTIRINVNFDLCIDFDEIEKITGEEFKIGEKEIKGFMDHIEKSICRQFGKTTYQNVENFDIKKTLEVQE